MKRISVCFMVFMLLIAAAACGAPGGNSASAPRESSEAQVPNPIVQFESLDAAKAALSYTAKIPLALPDGYQEKSCAVIGGDLLEIMYAKGDDALTYRMRPGDSDVSGDHNSYSIVSEVSVEFGGSDVKATMRGDGQTIMSTIWEAEGTGYSLGSLFGLDEAALKKIIESIT